MYKVKYKDGRLRGLIISSLTNKQAIEKNTVKKYRNIFIGHFIQMRLCGHCLFFIAFSQQKKIKRHESMLK